MTISGLPRPLPECRGCGAAMPRRRWAVATGLCRGCTTPAEAMGAAQRAARLSTVQPGRRGRRSTDERIERLAARRAARAGGDR